MPSTPLFLLGLTLGPSCLVSPAGCAAGWVLVDTACAAYSMTSVPLYDTLGPDAVTYICGHAELTVVACSIDVLDTLLKCLPECPTVKIVVCSMSDPATHIHDIAFGSRACDRDVQYWCKDLDHMANSCFDGDICSIWCYLHGAC